MQYEIQEDGMKIKVQPGIVGARVNQILAPYGRKIGPDPASINAVCGVTMPVEVVYWRP